MVSLGMDDVRSLRSIHDKRAWVHTDSEESVMRCGESKIHSTPGHAQVLMFRC